MRYFLLMAVAASMACAHAAPTLSPEAQTAFNNTRLIKGLDLLRDTAISANAQLQADGRTPALSTATTRKVVLVHRTAVRIIMNVPNGSKAVVLGLLDDLPTDLPPADWAMLQPYVALAKTLLNEVGK